MSADNTPGDTPVEVARARRPQWLILMMMGDFAFERSVAFSTGTFLEALAPLDVAPPTVRSTLQRMCDRGLLVRYRQGREVFFGLTPRSTKLLGRGQSDSWRSVDPEWDGRWTLLTFSIPEDRRQVRHSLRSRLSSAGFGMLKSGLWITPGDAEVATLIADLNVETDVHSFLGVPAQPTTVEALAREAYDIDALALRYRVFINRWRDLPSAAHDQLSALLMLQGEWQQIAQGDPRLPLRYLPSNWPAPEADRLFRDRFSTWEPPAQRRISEIARVLEVPKPHSM